MAYDTGELFKRAMKEIEAKKLVFHADVNGILGISTSTYYEHFPKESKEYKEIEIALNTNSVAIKAGIRNKWYKQGGSGSLYLYKLLGTREERMRLSVNYNEQVGPVEHRHRINTDDLDEETLLKLRRAYENRDNSDTSS